jgi:hypothetical protein
LANRLARDIAKALTGCLGDFIATATVKKNCELIGTTPDDLTADQLPVLFEKIEKSVSFFTDKDTAKVVLERVSTLKY